MSLSRTPHTLSISPMTKGKSGSRVDTMDPGAAVSVHCQITPMSPTTAFRDWNVATVRPHLMLYNILDANNVKLGWQGTSNGRTFVVKGAPMRWDAADSTNCMQCLLDELI